MATVKAENDNETGFDAETFVKLIALFDSSNAGEAENAHRKSVLMCAKKGLRWLDAARMTFGRSDNGDVSALQEQLRDEQAQHASHLEEASEAIRALRDKVTQLEAALSGDTEGASVVLVVRHRLRGAWVFPQFRLFVLTLLIWLGTVAQAAFSNHEFLSRVWAFVSLIVFGGWVIAQCRKEGFAQMLMKCAVYAAIFLCGGLLFNGLDLISPGTLLLTLAAALVMTISRLSEWLCELVRAKVWESGPAHVMRSWFVTP